MSSSAGAPPLKLLSLGESPVITVSMIPVANYGRRRWHSRILGAAHDQGNYAQADA